MGIPQNTTSKRFQVSLIDLNLEQKIHCFHFPQNFSVPPAFALTTALTPPFS